MKIKFSFLLLFLLANNLSYSQTDGAPNVQFSATPNVAALAQYVEAPVGYYSGTPSINIPLYTISTGGYQLPINLSYHASGIKVAQEASWVGLGWNLSAGGAITRQIRGRDDFFQGFSQGTGSTAYGYFYNYINYDDPFNDSIECVTNPWQETTGNYVIGGYDNPQCLIKHDAEPDMFMFNFGGYSGKFFLQAIQPTSGLPSLGKGVLLDKESNLKIEFDLSNDYSFTVTAPDGIKFEFNQKEKSKTDSWSSSDYVHHMSAETIDSWLLTRIILTNDQEINFDYTIASAPLYSQTHSSEIKEKIVELWGNSSTCVPGYERHKEFFSTTINEYRRFLNKIRWDGGEVLFNAVSLRNDIGGSSPKVDNIEIKNKDLSLVKKYEFDYGYFNDSYLNSSGIEQLEHLRLKLESLQEISLDTQTSSPPPYEFLYHEETNLPSKLSNQYDHWGYYNGATANNNTDKIPEMEVGVVAGEPKYLVIPKRNINFLKFLGSFATLPFEIADSFAVVISKGFRPVISNSKPIIDPIEDSKEVHIGIESFYANGGYFDSFSGAQRDPMIYYGKTATLKSVKHPTGGIEEYEYESNQYFPSLYKPVFVTSTNNGARIKNYFEFSYGPFVPYDGIVDQSGNDPNFYEFEVPDGQTVNSVSFEYELNKAVFDKIEPSYGYRLAIFKLDDNNNEVQEVANVALSNNTANYTWSDVGTSYESGISNEQTINTSLSDGKYRLRFEIYSIPFIGTNSSPVSAVNTDYLDTTYFLEGKMSYQSISNYNRVISIPTGGLRIKKITSPKNTRQFNYESTVDAVEGVSTGILLSELEYFTSYLAQDRCGDGGSNSSTILRRKSNSNYALTGTVSGNIVGYSKVTEEIINNATSESIKTIYEYHNSKELKTGFGGPNIPNYMNGKLKNVKKYNGNTLVQEINTEYDNVLFNYIKGFSYTSPSPDYYQHQFATEYEIPTEYNPVSITKQTDFTLEGNIENYKFYHYDFINNAYFGGHLNPSEIEEEFSNGNTRTQKIYYPETFGSVANTDQDERDQALDLIDAYRINIPLQTEIYMSSNSGNRLISKSRLNYVNGVPDIYKSAMGDEALEDKVIYTKHDSSHNIIEIFNPLTNTYTTYIWSYNKMYPVAKIEHATFSQVKEVLNITDDDDLLNFDKNNLDDLDALRTDSRLKDAMVTTYVYKELVGIESITDPRENKTTYHYDGMNRLKYVTDSSGNKLSENEYYYKNQQ